MGEPMQKAICKACAGHVITARRRQSAIAAEPQQCTGEGEVKSLPPHRLRTAALPFFTSPQVRKLFLGFPQHVLTGDIYYVRTTKNPDTSAFGQG